MWVFGYGSLVWRPAFEHVERVPAYVEGFVRRFYQGSTDHRGVPGAPGRVVTLLPETGASCWGMAYRVAQEHVEPVTAELDHREKGGYARHAATAHRADGTPLAEVLLYVATPDNPNWLGPSSLERIAAQVRAAHGPSGANVEYVLELARGLRAMNATDDHVFELAALLEPA